MIVRSAVAILSILAALIGTVVIHSSLGRAQEAADWYSAERGRITVWHSLNQARADDFADHANGAYDLVSDLIDADLSQDLIVVVWPSGADPADVAQRPPLDQDDAIISDVFRDTSGDVRSAVTDALINEAAGAYAADVPIWFRFALGFWSRGPLPGFYLTRAGSVILFDHEEFYSIEQLETVPSTWQFQAKYFGQAGGMLAWWIQDWGAEALADLLDSVADGVPFYDAVEQVYGIPEDRLISEFTKNAERALLLLWPYIEEQTPPFYERLNINHILIVAVSIPGAILLFFIGKRLFWD